MQCEYQIKVSHFTPLDTPFNLSRILSNGVKKIKFAMRSDAIRVSGIKIFPEIMLDAKIKLRIATVIPNISCLFLSGGDVNGSGNITIEKKITVGLSSITGRALNELPKFIKVSTA